METKHIFSIRRNERGYMEFEYSRYIGSYAISETIYPFVEDHEEVIQLRYKVEKLKKELLKMQQKYEPLPLNLDEIFI